MIHTDHLGTPHKMTDANQTIVWSAYYKPFGAATTTVSTITNNMRFPGQYFDAETGLNYNYMRDYNPVIGRYIQSDPLGLGGGINPYGYARQNPLSFKDFNGLDTCEQIGDWQEVTNSSRLCGNSREQTLWKFERYDEINAFNCECTWRKSGLVRIYDKKCFKEEAVFRCKKKDKCGKETTYTKNETRDSERSRKPNEFDGWTVVIPSFYLPTITRTTIGQLDESGCGCPNPNIETSLN